MVNGGAAAGERLRKIIFNLNIKVCKHFLVNTQNKCMNLKKERNVGAWIQSPMLITLFIRKAVIKHLKPSTFIFF